ncbi:MAG: tetratricopeptide repeat protein [Gemmataceae bacterium]
MADMNAKVKALWEQLGAAIGGGKLDDAKAIIPPLVEAAEEQEAAEPEFDASELETAVWFHLGNAFSSQQQFSDSEDAFRECVEVAGPRAMAKQDDDTRQDLLAQATFNLGNALLGQQKVADAAERFRMAIGIWQRLAGKNLDQLRIRHDLSRAFFNLAYSRHDHPPEAVDAYKQAQLNLRRMLCRQEHEAARFDLARSGINLCISLQQVSESEEAERVSKQAVADHEELVRRYPGRPEYEQGLKDAKEHHQGFTKHLAEQRGSVDRLIKNLPPVPVAAISGAAAEKLRNAGTELLAAAGASEKAFHPELAVKAYQRAFAFFSELKGVDSDPRSGYLEAASAYDLAILYRDISRPDSAEYWQRRSIRLLQARQREMPNDRQTKQLLADSWNNVGILLQNSIRLADAEEAYDQSRSVRDALLKEERDDRNLTSLGGTLCNLGNIARDRFDRSAAIAFYDQSLNLLDEVLARQPEHALAKAFQQNAKMGKETVLGQQPPPQVQFGSVASTGPQYFGPRPWLPPNMDTHAVEQLLSETRTLRPDTGWTTLQRVFPQGKADASAWYVLGLARAGFLQGTSHQRETWDERKAELALEAFAEALALKPDFGEAWLYRGVHQLHRFLVTQSTLHAIWGGIQHLDENGRRQLFDPMQRWSRDVFLRTRDSLQQAATHLPDAPLPWTTMAKLFRDIGDEPQVVDALREAVRRDPSLIDELREEFPFVEASDLA